MKASRRLLGLGILVTALAAATPAQADSYDPKRAGHPLRILAYIVHPFGVALDYLIFRPAHWVVSHEPLDDIFGHTRDY
jgi:hypothetical protein